ncbi:PadR family transcriptional regulator [Desulfobacula sp.]|uniref:PadR family transcriptional regulator n=1 Tax=Desulfobacula sp. TaxID=2593537 RepID=UPI0026355D6F|nr:PadR family transcriptional regulator [Desulfobacula sp.]
MSAVNLVILGILKKQSMNAYEMNKHIAYIRLKNWMKIGAPTVYQNLKKLAEKGYLSTGKAKTGNMPEKVIYTITASGNEYFDELMGRFSKTPSPIYFDFNAFLINLDLVDKDRGIAMLKNLKQYFQSSYANLKKDQEVIKDPPMGGKAIMEQYDQLFTTMINWSDGLIEEYEKDASNETEQF